MSVPRPISISGFGLLSARPARVEIQRSDSGGIRFIAASGDCIPALISHQRTAEGPLGGRNTVLGKGNVSIATVEHLLSALAGSNLWHADVHCEGGELPILDGSAADFASALRDVPAAPGTPVRLRSTIRVEHASSGAWIEASPSDRIRYRYELRYPAGSGLREQEFEWDGNAASYSGQIAPSRTFSLEHEARAMRAAGLFPHLTPRDMLVIAPDGGAIENKLRFPDEPARHKLLDLIGDLALLGGPLIANVTAHKSSHALTHELCRRIVAGMG